MEVNREMLEAFAAASRKAARYGLMRCSSGNLSWRLDDGLMLVKASRSWMSDLTADDIAVCRIETGEPINDRKPSVEIGFHAGVLRTREDVNVVLHFQAPFATTLVCSDPSAVNYFAIPEIAYYIGPIGIVPYILPGTKELAAEVMRVMKNHNLAQLTNHGQVTVGRDFDEAIQRAVFFELACEVIVRAGERLKPLSAEAVALLRAGGNV